MDKEKVAQARKAYGYEFPSPVAQARKEYDEAMAQAREVYKEVDVDADDEEEIEEALGGVSGVG